MTRPRSAGAVAIGNQREADDPGDRVGRALHQPRGEQPRQAVRVREQQRRRREREHAADQRRLAPDAIGDGAHRDRDRQQRHAEGREQQSDHRRRRAEPPAQIRQHRHRDRVGDDVGEGREGDERDGDRARATQRHCTKARRSTKDTKDLTLPFV